MRHVYAPIADSYLFNMQTVSATKRRSHLYRKTMGKGVQVTEKDIIDIFEPLSRHAQLSTRQLVAYGSRYPTITKARLSELWHSTGDERTHWLHRLNEDVLFANHLCVEDLHRLGYEAERLLCAKGIVPDQEWVAATRIGGRSTSPSRVIRLAHDHMASDIALDIEIGARAAGAAFRSHIDILKNAPEATRHAKRPMQIPVTLDGRRTFVEPDALFAINDRVYALEADKGTESIRAVIVQKIRAYREIVAARTIDEWLGVDNLTVLFATANEARMRNIMRELQTIARNGRSIMFGFRTETSFAEFMRAAPPTGRLATAPWNRAGFDDLVVVNASE